MKNVQIIDRADNCTYDIYQISDEKFRLVFPDPNQEIEFIEDVEARLSPEAYKRLFDGFWDNFVPRETVRGIHGTIFYQLESRKKTFPTKRFDEQHIDFSTL